VDDSSFQAKVIDASNERPVLVDFYTDWCGPCKLIEPMLRELHGKDCTVVKAKPSECERWRKWVLKHGGAHLQVVAVPTCMLFVGGRPLRAMAGKFTKDRLHTFVGRQPDASTVRTG